MKKKIVLLFSFLPLLLSGCVTRTQLKKSVDAARQFEQASDFQKISEAMVARDKWESEYRALWAKQEDLKAKLKVAEEEALRCK